MIRRWERGIHREERENGERETWTRKNNENHIRDIGRDTKICEERID